MIIKKTKVLQVLFLGVSLLISGAAQSAPKKNNQQLSDDLNAMQLSIGKVEKDMQQLRRLLDNRAMLELFQRMDELADEVSQLRGLLEQQNHDLAGLKNASVNFIWTLIVAYVTWKICPPEPPHLRCH